MLQQDFVKYKLQPARNYDDMLGIADELAEVPGQVRKQAPVRQHTPHTYTHEDTQAITTHTTKAHMPSPHTHTQPQSSLFFSLDVH